MPTLRMTCRDDVNRYEILVPPDAEILFRDGTAIGVTVPCPFEEDQRMELTDEFLVASARDGDFGLRVLSEAPLENGALPAGTMPAESGQDVTTVNVSPSSD